MPSPRAERPRKRPPAGFALAGGALTATVVVAIAFFAVARPQTKKHMGDAAGGKKAAARILAIAGPPSLPFELKYPSGWRKIPDAQLKKVSESPPIAAIRRSDGRGVITLSVGGPLGSPLAELRGDFARELASRFPDFELVTSSELDVEAGRGIYTSWVLRDSGRVQGNLTVPIGAHSYTLDATLPTGATDVAREVGAIFASFDVKP